ncbi:MAG TPA: DLW-39 family protein [Trebonia sp.]
MKKLLVLGAVLLSGFAVWRKVQSQRADLDLWSEATSPDDY